MFRTGLIICGDEVMLWHCWLGKRLVKIRHDLHTLICLSSGKVLLRSVDDEVFQSCCYPPQCVYLQRMTEMITCVNSSKPPRSLNLFSFNFKSTIMEKRSA